MADTKPELRDVGLLWSKTNEEGDRNLVLMVGFFTNTMLVMQMFNIIIECELNTNKEVMYQWRYL